MSAPPLRAAVAARNGQPDAAPAAYRFAPFTTFAAHSYPNAEPILGTPGHVLLAAGSLLLLYGAPGSGKSTLTLDAAAHLCAGRAWLDLRVPRPARVLLIENEGPPGLFQAKVTRKRDTWDGQDFTDNLHVYSAPWGSLTFADPHARQQLADYCREHRIDVVMANPVLGLGAPGGGLPEETSAFVRLLHECGLGENVAFWLLHHPNKAGAVSGDWERHADTVLRLEPDGNRQRTRLHFAKARWATLAPDERTVLLDWQTDTQGYTVSQRSASTSAPAAPDAEYVERLHAYLTGRPPTPQATITRHVKGTDSKLIEALRGHADVFHHTTGRHGARLWSLTTSAREPQT